MKKAEKLENVDFLERESYFSQHKVKKSNLIIQIIKI